MTQKRLNIGINKSKHYDKGTGTYPRPKLAFSIFSHGTVNLNL